jgi:hypothetical protein
VNEAKDVDKLLHTRKWRGYTTDESEDEAAAKFTTRYGEPPEYIVEDGGVLWVGPIPERKES